MSSHESEHVQNNQSVEPPKVVVNVDLVRQLFLARLEYAFDEISSDITTAGIPAWMLPTPETKTFGRNSFIFGMMNDDGSKDNVSI